MSKNVKEVNGRTLIPIETCNFTWSIENFSLCSYKCGQHLTSPMFTTAKSFLTTWCLNLYPNGKKKGESDGKIGIYLTRTSADSSAHYAIFKISFIGANLANYYSVDFEHVYDSPKSGWGSYDFIDRNTLLETERLSLLPQDTLTVKCELKTSRVDNDVVSELTEDSNSIDYSTPVVSKKPDSLLCDLRNLYESEIFSDFTLKVGDQKLLVHKNILCARSSVFNTMLKHDMKEKLTNCAEINDLEPNVVKIMVRYMYCGQIEDLCPEVCIQLYSAAEKYDLRDLKKVCVEYLLGNMTVENVCDVLTLGDLHIETELVAAARNFICMNASSIQETEKWLNLSLTKPDLVFALNKVIITERRKKDNSNIEANSKLNP